MKESRSDTFREECFTWWKLVTHDKEKAALLAEERNITAMQHTDYTNVKDSDYQNSLSPKSPKEGRFRKSPALGPKKFLDEDDKALGVMKKIVKKEKKKTSVIRAEVQDEDEVENFARNPLLDSDDDDLYSGSRHGRGSGSAIQVDTVSQSDRWLSWWPFNNACSTIWPQSPPVSPSFDLDSSSAACGSGTGAGGGKKYKKKKDNKSSAKVVPEQKPRIQAAKPNAFDKWSMMEEEGHAQKQMLNALKEKKKDPSAARSVGVLALPQSSMSTQQAEAEAEAQQEISCWFHIRRRDYALCCLPRGNCIRRCCEWISSQSAFDNIVLVFIGIQSCLMAYERPAIEDDSFERYILDMANQCFVLLFSLELLIKVVANGFVIGPIAYLDNDWNKLDFFVVLVSWTDLLLAMFVGESGGIMGILRVLRLLRALRPLRAIRRAPKLRLVVKTVMASVRPIGETMLVCLVFLFIFGVLGVQVQYLPCLACALLVTCLVLNSCRMCHCLRVIVWCWQLFAEKYSYCGAPEDISTQCMYEASLCITTKEQCIARGYLWSLSSLNFDNILNACITLFFICTGDGWVTIMHQGVDGVGADMQPQRNANQISALYFVCAVIIGQFFLINLFIGVVVDNFSRMAHLVEHQEAEGQVMSCTPAVQSITCPSAFCCCCTTAVLSCRRSDCWSDCCCWYRNQIRMKNSILQRQRGPSMRS